MINERKYFIAEATLTDLTTEPPTHVDDTVVPNEYFTSYSTHKAMTTSRQVYMRSTIHCAAECSRDPECDIFSFDRSDVTWDGARETFSCTLMEVNDSGDELHAERATYGPVV